MTPSDSAGNQNTPEPGPFHPRARPVSAVPILWARPLFPLAAAHMAGIALGGAFPLGFLPGAVVCIAAFAALAVMLRFGRRARVFPLLLLAGLGYLAVQPFLAAAPSPGHITGFIDAGRIHIVGTVAGPPVEGSGRQRFVLRVEQAGRTAPPLADAFGRLRVTAAGEGPRLNRGDRVRFDAKIRGFLNFENPGGFDYRRYMALRGIRASAYIRAENLFVLYRAAPGRLDAFRTSLISQIDRRLDPPAAGLLRALVVGDRRGLSPELKETFNRAGVGHILAISGLHVGIVAAAAFFAFGRMFVCIPLLLQKAWTRKAAALVSMAAVVGYGMLAGMSPSTQRAVIMVCTFMLGLVFGRQSDPINTLALAALAILIVDPGALFTASFQLSFSAVLAILYGLEPCRRPAFLSGHKAGLLRRGALFVYVSLLAILGTLPLTAFYFNRVSLVGLAANCLAIPLVGFCAVPLGLLSGLVFAVSPALAGAGMQAAGFVLDAAAAGIAGFAALPFAAPRMVTPSFFETAVYYLLFAAALNLHRSRAARVIAAAALMLAGADICHWIQHRLWHPDLRVTAVDVGQGSASLLELPRGKCILIDGGGFSDNRIFDVGAGVVAPLLWRKKIRTLDAVVLSHPNSDHLNGLIYIVENFGVRAFWSNGQPSETFGYRELMAALARRKIPVPRFEQIPRTRTVNGVEIAILHPPADFRKRTAAGPWAEPNNNSIVVKATFKEISLLFPGDAMAAAEREMTENGCARLASTVLAAPHHGSRTSSTGAFLDCVAPEAVLVSSGWRQRRFFPHPTVAARYRNRNLRVFCTHTHGAVTIATDGLGYRVDTVLGEPIRPSENAREEKG